MSVFLQLEDNETQPENSKFFGEIVLPEKWVEENVFSPFELFVCQINLQEIGKVCKEFNGKNGTLYFFIDMKKRPYKSVVRYYDGEMDALLNFNEDAECDENVIDELSIDFSTSNADDVGISMLVRDENCGEDVALLKVEYDEEEPLLPVEGDAYFLISESDLASGNYSKTKLKIVKK